MSPNRKLAIGVTIATVLVLAAAFMPWGELTGKPDFGTAFGGSNSFPDVSMTVAVNGVNGTLNLGWIKLPNWLVALSAFSVAALCWLRALSIWDTSTAVLCLIAGYGLLHTGIMVVVLAVGGSRGSLGIGGILTLAAFINILVTVARHSHTPMPASPSEPQESPG